MKVTFPLATLTPGTNSGNLATASLTPNLAISFTYLAVALHKAYVAVSATAPGIFATE